MKNIVIYLVTLLLISGCGLDKKNLSDAKLLDDSEIVTYSDEGIYDLSDYLFPKQNTTYIYQRKNYRDNQVYKIEDNRVEYKIFGDTIKEGSDINYTIKDITIQKIELIDDFYDVREYRRFVDINDTYYSFQDINLESILYQIGWLTCKVEEHNSSIEVLDRNYSDVLTLMCKSESSQGVRGEFRESKQFTTRLYFAKDIGKIKSDGKECTVREYNRIYKSCIRKVKELKEILE